MSEICMMSLTRDEVAERKDYDAIKASFDDLWSSINSNENANVSICTSEGTCLFVDREQQRGPFDYLLGAGELGALDLVCQTIGHETYRGNGENQDCGQPVEGLGNAAIAACGV